VTITGATSTLTTQGVAAFSDFYRQGDQLDTVNATFGLIAAEGDTAPTVPAPATPTGNGGTDNSSGPSTTPTQNGTTPVPGGGATIDDSARCEANSVSSASMTWGVRDSFRAYVAGPIANGAISTSGVTQNSDGTFTWSGGSGAYNSAGSAGRASFGGSVSFSGHGGILDMTIGSPQVQITGPNSANLLAAVRSNAPDGTLAVDTDSVLLASLVLPSPASSGADVTWTGAAATLTSAGAEAFGGFYQAGESLDGVTLTLPLGAGVDCDASTGTLPNTGVEHIETAGLAALGLMLLGTTAVVASRRRTAAAE
jgi:LPXTG-motif cell wall-anchored protein